jgi:hypothetical protein
MPIASSILCRISKDPCGWGLVVVGQGVRSGNNDVIESNSLKISLSYSRYPRTLLETYYRKRDNVHKDRNIPQRLENNL